MGNSYFRFKQFTVEQERAAMKVTTDACLFGAWTARDLRSSHGIEHIADIGTGTGLLSLMTAQQTTADIDAIDIDHAAAEQAKSNVEASPWAERIRVFTGDAREYTFPRQYDVIISNPPFYENELSSGNNQKDMAHHDKGLRMNELLDIIARNLKENGRFYLLLPFKRYAEIKQLISDCGMKLGKVYLVKQTTSHDFFRVMVSGGKTDQKTETHEIAIKGDNGEYSPEFHELLRDYYLYL